MQKNAGFILLLLAGMFLLMLAISGRFHDIFTAAFPSLGGKSSGDSSGTSDSGLSGEGTSSSLGNQAPEGAGGGSPGSGLVSPLTGQPIHPPTGSDPLSGWPTLPRTGAALVPLPSGGFQYQI